MTFEITVTHAHFHSGGTQAVCNLALRFQAVQCIQTKGTLSENTHLLGVVVDDPLVVHVRRDDVKACHAFVVRCLQNACKLDLATQRRTIVTLH